MYFILVLRCLVKANDHEISSGELTLFALMMSIIVISLRIILYPLNSITRTLELKEVTLSVIVEFVQTSFVTN